jgi:hypothetical protein
MAERVGVLAHTFEPLALAFVCSPTSSDSASCGESCLSDAFVRSRLFAVLASAMSLAMTLNARLAESFAIDCQPPS